MPRVRDPDLPQHHMDQGHYGAMDLDLLPSGTAQGDVILWDDGSNTWYIDQPPTGGGGGGSGTIDLLVGDDQTFNGSMGNWTNSGGTRELGFGMLAERPQGTDYSASMKFTTTANSQYVDILVSGTFLEGHFYSSAILINSPDATPPTVQAILGLIGTDSSTETYASLVSGSDPNEDWGVIYVSWVPTADRIGVSLRINRSAGTGTKIFNIGYVRVVNGPMPFIEGRNGDTLVPANFSLATRYGLEGVQMNMNDEAGSEWYLDVYRDGISAGANVFVWPNGGWNLWANEASGDRNFTGMLMVGDDYVGVALGEADASTLQMFPVDDHDIILLDGDWEESTRHWIARNQSGTQSVNLSSALSNPDVVPTSKGWVVPSLASDPTGPMEGQFYYNSTTDVYRGYINGGWADFAAGQDIKVKGSSNDTTADFLIPKISGAGTVDLYEYNDGGNEIIVISGSSTGGTDEKVKVSSNDTTAEYLFDKLVAGTNVTLVENNNGGDESITIQVTSGSLAIGPFVGTKAYSDTTQSIPDATETAVALNQEEYDTDAFHDNTTNNSRFTVPVGKGGKYRLTAGVNFTAGASPVAAKAFWRLNGTTAIRARTAFVPTSTTQDTAVIVATEAVLADGDYVEIIVYQDSSGARNIGHASAPEAQSFGSLSLQVTGTTGSLEFIGAKAYADGTQSISDATLTAVAFNQEEWDTDAFHDNATNNSRFTVSAGKAGKYRLTGGVFLAGATSPVEGELFWRLNGTTRIRAGLYWKPATTPGSGQIVTTEASLAVGDYVELIIFQDSSGALNIGHASAPELQSFGMVSLIAAGAAGKSMVTSNDTTSDYLYHKISGSGTVSTYEYYDGSDELLVISGSTGLPTSKAWLTDNYNPDDYPASPDTVDDEFEGSGSIDEKWTKTNDPAGGDAWNQTTFTGFARVGLVELGTDNVANYVLLTQIAPAGTATARYRIKAALAMSGLGAEQAEFAHITVCLIDTANGIAVGSGIHINNADGGGNLLPFPQHDTAGAPNSMATTDTAHRFSPGQFVYLELRKDTTAAYTSANTYTAWLSKDGLVWHQSGSASATFTATPVVGISIRRPKAQTGTPAGEVVIDFFRKVA